MKGAQEAAERRLTAANKAEIKRPVIHNKALVLCAPHMSWPLVNTKHYSVTVCCYYQQSARAGLFPQPQTARVQIRVSESNYCIFHLTQTE